MLEMENSLKTNFPLVDLYKKMEYFIKSLAALQSNYSFIIKARNIMWVEGIKLCDFYATKISKSYHFLSKWSHFWEIYVTFLQKSAKKVVSDEVNIFAQKLQTWLNLNYLIDFVKLCDRMCELNICGFVDKAPLFEVSVGT